MGGRHVACRILKSQLPDSNVDVYLIDQPQYFDRDALYGDIQGDYRDNCERFLVLLPRRCPCHRTNGHATRCGALSRLAIGIYFLAYVATGTGGYSWTRNAATIMTVHNLAYQGQILAL